MSDVYIDITYPIDHPEKNKVKTNIKRDLLLDFMCDNVIRGMMGKGKDGGKATKRKVYHIRITCDLSCDEVKVKHDCGNAGLMTGIVMDVTRRMDKGGN